MFINLTTAMSSSLGCYLFPVSKLNDVFSSETGVIATATAVFTHYMNIQKGCCIALSHRTHHNEVKIPSFCIVGFDLQIKTVNYCKFMQKNKQVKEEETGLLLRQTEKCCKINRKPHPRVNCLRKTWR